MININKELKYKVLIIICTSLIILTFVLSIIFIILTIKSCYLFDNSSALKYFIILLITIIFNRSFAFSRENLCDSYEQLDNHSKILGGR